MFGLMLAQARNEKRITIRELAKAVGVNDSFITHLEKGRRTPPPLSVVIKIAKALDTPPEQFLIPALIERWSADLWSLIEWKCLDDPSTKIKSYETLGALFESMADDLNLSSHDVASYTSDAFSGQHSRIPPSFRYAAVLLFLRKLEIDFDEQNITLHDLKSYIESSSFEQS